MKGADSRAAAALAVHGVRERGQSLTRLLADSLLRRAPVDRALTQELAYGTLRTLPRLEALAALLLHRPMRPADRDLESLILVGLYQITALSTPAHAAVAATVDAARLIGKPEKAGLVNALLRRCLREREELNARVESLPAGRWLFPDWLLEQLQSDWPEHWEAIVTASNGRAPMTLRVNACRNDRRAYAALLAESGIASRPAREFDTGLTLDRPMPFKALPGFDDGLVSVQDAGAQLAAVLLDARPGERVLDACAAPGGKTAAILERAGGRLDLVAIDSDRTRLETLEANLERLGLEALVETADAGNPSGEWAESGFDRILLDVPCSATGVIRRHPDIKWLRHPEDIPPLCEQQRRILDAAWLLLRPGGRLLYCTCSLLAAENQDQIAAFLARASDVVEVPVPADWGLSRVHGRQLLPRPGGADGFYFAILERRLPARQEARP